MGLFFNKANKALNNNFTNDEKFIKKSFQKVHKELNLYSQPETYKTLLKENYGSNTESTLVRKKLNNLLKQQMLLCINVKLGNHKGNKDKLFFSIEKDYFIVICSNKIFYCDNTSIKEDYLILKDAYELNDCCWGEKGNFKVKLKEVLKCL